MQHRRDDLFVCFTELCFKGEPCYLVKQKGLHVGPLDKHTFPEKTRTQLHFNLLEEASTTSSWTVQFRLGFSSDPQWESCAARETMLAYQTMEPLTAMPSLPGPQYSQSTVSRGLGCHSPSLLCSPGADQLASRVQGSISTEELQSTFSTDQLNSAQIFPP